MLQAVAKLLWRKFNKCCMHVYMYVRLYLYTENHQLNILSFKKTKIYLQLLDMTAERETDMLDSFLRWAKDPTFFLFAFLWKLLGKLFYNVAPPEEKLRLRKYNHLIGYISNSNFKFKFSNSKQSFEFNLPVFAAKRIFKTYQQFSYAFSGSIISRFWRSQKIQFI